jgi:hypothetical protein
MKRLIRSFFIAIMCIGKKPHSKPRRYQLFVDGMGKRLFAFFRFLGTIGFLGLDIRMTRKGDAWFQFRERREEKKRTKRIIHALTKS